jgi:alpha,alpha-trehalose phosphorylase
MLHHERVKPPTQDYPPNEWSLIEKSFRPEFAAQMETVMALANGYLGMRGVHDEGGPSVQNGTFVNGFYETWPIVYGEEAYGFARTGQTMLDVTDSKMIRLFVDDEPFWLPDANIRHYERQLNMKAGVSIERLFGRPPRASGFVLDRGAWFPFRSVMWRRSRMR